MKQTGIIISSEINPPAKKGDIQLINLGNLRKNQELVDRITVSLSKGKKVLLFYFDIARLHEIEEGAGFDVAKYIIELFNDTLAHGLNELYKKKVKVLAAESLWGDDFVLITEAPASPTLATLENLSIAYRKHIRENMNAEFKRIAGRDIDIHIGYAIITEKAPSVEIQLYNATKKAYGLAKGFIRKQSMRYLPEFNDILATRKLRSVYQPIVSTRSAAVLGWESLIRGPQDSYFRHPDNIFTFAEEEGLLLQLEKSCRESALNNIGEMGPGQKLFINVHPNAINESSFKEGEEISLLRNLSIKPANIVFEITERHHIKDFSSINRILRHFRDQGFMVAVDDVGCGFSTLQSIAEIRPDYLKIDMSLVRGIHKDRIKTALMETMVAFAEKIGSEVIAEGVEEEAELAALVDIGVHYAQGYFLGRPSFPKQATSEEAFMKLQSLGSNGRHQILRHAFPINDIIEKALSVDEGVPVKDVKILFDETPDLSGIVVTGGSKPAGLIMRQHLDRHLGKKFGVALYYEKPIGRIMDRQPLIVDITASVELVSQAAMNRNKLRLYDNIIVTQEGLLRGVVSVQTLLDTMTRIRLELAKGANPLTGLPGNISIEQEYYRYCKEENPFSMIFIDLDNFKSYNDKYGFEKGDEVLLFTAGILKECMKACSNENVFIGHIGGDDFIILTETAGADVFCECVIEQFDEGIKSLYSHEDREAGGISAHDRSGQERWFPFISISMAVLDQKGGGDSSDLKEISGTVAQLKSYAKSQPGSICVRDRRR